MIGMMYLFYTALLALNVSAEVIQAFAKIDESISQTTANFSAKTNSLYNTIAAKVKEQKGKYEGLSMEANKIQKSTNELFNYVDSLKAAIIEHSEGVGCESVIRKDGTLEIRAAEIQKKDNLEASHQILGPERGQQNQGLALRKKIESHRAMLLSYVRDTSESVFQNIIKSLQTYDGVIETKDGPRTWEQRYYQAMPMIGTIALLSKLQADLRNAEADILEYMIKDLEGLDIRITALEGLISTSTSFVVRGGEYSAKIFLGALDTTMRPTIHLTSQYPYWDSLVEEGEVKYKLRSGANYDSLPVDRSGKGLYKVQCGGVGDFSYGGLIHYKSNKGDKWLPFMGKYQVGEAGFTVSAAKCNVFYKGLENPVEVSVSGYPKESISVTASGGATIRAAQGGYIVTIAPGTAVKEVAISVSVKTAEGGKSLGSKTFKVFDVPPPTIMIAGTYRDGAEMPLAAILTNSYLTATLGGGFFPFDGVKYSVNKYDFMYSIRGVAQRVTVQGSKMSDQVLAEIKKMGSGAQLSFTNIYYDGPSGTKQTNGVSVKIK